MPLQGVLPMLFRENALTPHSKSKHSRDSFGFAQDRLFDCAPIALEHEKVLAAIRSG
jgi:hypothetical protein